MPVVALEALESEVVRVEITVVPWLVIIVVLSPLVKLVKGVIVVL